MVRATAPSSGVCLFGQSLASVEVWKSSEIRQLEVLQDCSAQSSQDLVRLIAGEQENHLTSRMKAKMLDLPMIRWFAALQP